MRKKVRKGSPYSLGKKAIQDRKVNFSNKLTTILYHELILSTIFFFFFELVLNWIMHGLIYMTLELLIILFDIVTII